MDPLPHVQVRILAPTGRGHYQLQWRPQPGSRKRVSVTTGTADPAEAERLRQQTEACLQLGHTPPLLAQRRRGRRTAGAPSTEIQETARPLTWQEFRAIYEAEAVSARKPTTRENVARQLRQFERHAHPTTLAGVDAACLARYCVIRRQLGHKPSTIKVALGAVLAALRWGRKRGLVAAVPEPPEVRVPVTGPGRHLTPDEFGRLVRAAPTPLWKAFLWCAWLAGLRRGELLALVWDRHGGAQRRPWVDLDGRRLWLPAEWVKGGRDQWLPLHAELAAVLRPFRQDSGPVFPLGTGRWVWERVRDIARAAGLEGVHLRMLRRSLASRYAPEVSAPVLQRLMRHSDIRTTLAHYADVGGELDEAIHALPGSGRRPTKKIRRRARRG